MFMCGCVYKSKSSRTQNWMLQTFLSPIRSIIKREKKRTLNIAKQNVLMIKPDFIKNSSHQNISVYHLCVSSHTIQEQSTYKVFI